MNRRVTLARFAGATFTVLTLAGCGGGGGDGGVTNPPPPPPPAAVGSVTVTLAAGQVNVGQTSQATAVLRDAQNNVLSGRTVTWSSSNTSVASVNATTGLATGVGAGTANIIATSEGRTGQASITVTPVQTAPPQISALTITQNGQAANLAQVAGRLSVNFTLNVPAGYSGTLILRVDTAEFHRESISAPAFSIRGDGSVVAEPDVVAKQIIVDTHFTTVSRNLGTDLISEIPAIRNGAHIATLTVQPTVAGGQSVTQTFNLTTNNPIHAHGLVSFNGTTAIGADSKTYTNGNAVASVIFANYGTDVINGFELTLTDLKANYRTGPITSYQKITRTDFNTFTIPAAAVEKPDLAFILSSVVVNGVNVVPQTVYIGNSQATTDLNGSGFANTQQQAQGLTPPAGTEFQLVTQPSIDLLSGNIRMRLGIDALNLDNLGPRQTSLPNEPVFSFLDRMTTVGGAAWWPNYGFGAIDGQLSSRYEFEGGFRSNRLVDGAGIDATKTEYYAAPISDQANLFKPQYKIGTTFSLNESSGSRTYTAGARAFDKLGNYSDWTIRTSPKNPWNIQGSLSLSPNIGLDVGAFGYTQTRANLNLTAFPAGIVWNLAALDATMCWLWNVTSSVVGIPNGFLSARGRLNGVWGLGAGTASDQYQILNSIGGVSGGGTATIFLSQLLNQIYSKAGGASNQGLYEIDFKAADNAGRYIGDNMYPKSYRILYDYTAPIGAGITYNGTVTAGQPATGTLTGTDNYGLMSGRLGIRFDFTSTLFFGGQVYVPIGEIPIPALAGGAPNKSLSMPIMGTAPIGFRFFNPSSGAIDMGNFYRSNGTSWQLEDLAHNLSTTTFAPFSNTATIPTISNVSSVKASMSSTNWCPGTCAGGGENLVDLIFNFLDPRASGTPDLSKAEWFGIPQSGGGVVYPLGRATTLTSAVEGTGRRLSYNLQFDVKKYCGPPGPMQVFAIGYNTAYYLKVNPFFSVNVQTPTRFSNECLKF